jgi:nuclear GTP-binding protein
VPCFCSVWKYITLFKRIFLIDCPGVVYTMANNSETESVLKGVVRVENLSEPSDYIDAVLQKVKKEYLRKTYDLDAKRPKQNAAADADADADADGSAEGAAVTEYVHDWSNAHEFLEVLAVKSGKLLRGAEADVNTVARMVLNDWQRVRHRSTPQRIPSHRIASQRQPCGR